MSPGLIAKHAQSNQRLFEHDMNSANDNVSKISFKKNTGFSKINKYKQLLGKSTENRSKSIIPKSITYDKLNLSKVNISNTYDKNYLNNSPHSNKSKND